jgi:hypothetical protein
VSRRGCRAPVTAARRAFERSQQQQQQQHQWQQPRVLSPGRPCRCRCPAAAAGISNVIVERPPLLLLGAVLALVSACRPATGSWATHAHTPLYAQRACVNCPHARTLPRTHPPSRAALRCCAARVACAPSSHTTTLRLHSCCTNIAFMRKVSGPLHISSLTLQAFVGEWGRRAGRGVAGRGGAGRVWACCACCAYAPVFAL